MNRLIFHTLVGMFAVTACAEIRENDKEEPKDTGPKDAGASKSTDDTDIGTDTGTETEETPTDTTPPPGDLGEPCWVEVLPSGHPNMGLSDCEESFTCIGNSSEAWCTARCLIVGSISDAPSIDGWCCGEIGDVCAPSKYWMPASMDGYCAPREIPLGQPCVSGGESRCAPMCTGGEKIADVTCAATSLEGGFCTRACETHADCVEEVPFSEGCCGEIMGGTYCLPEIADDCLPIL